MTLTKQEKWMFAAVLFLWAVIITLTAVHTSTADADELVGPARIASTTTTTIGPQEDRTLFAARDFCAGRAVTTLGTSAIMLSFDSTMNPSGTIGHLQAASTTAYYSASQYGCGAVTAYGFASSSVSATTFGL